MFVRGRKQEPWVILAKLRLGCNENGTVSSILSFLRIAGPKIA